MQGRSQNKKLEDKTYELLKKLEDKAYELLEDDNLRGLMRVIKRNPWLLKTKYFFGLTLLHLACANDQKEMAELLLTSGAEVNALDDGGETPLCYSLGKARLGTVKVLIQHKANLELGEPLYWASIDPNREQGIVEELVKAGARSRGDEVFVDAVMDGDEALVDLFIDNKFSVDTRDGEGNSLLTWAACLKSDERHYRIAEKLLLHHADVNAKNNRGRTALYGAVSSESESEPLLNLVTLYLEYGAKIDTVDNDGVTPLLYAANHAKLPMVKLLVERASQVGIKLDHEDSQGRNLLHHAACSDHADVCQYFIDKKIDHNALDHQGWTPLHYACNFGQYQNVFALLKIGASTNIRNRAGKTPLDILNGYVEDYDALNSKHLKCIRVFAQFDVARSSQFMWKSASISASLKPMGEEKNQGKRREDGCPSYSF